MSYTPGPWTVSHPFAWKAEIRSPTRFIGTAGRANGTAEEMEANARLMAAAPAMAEVLQDVVDAADDAKRTSPDYRIPIYVTAARALLARIEAKGERL